MGSDRLKVVGVDTSRILAEVVEFVVIRDGSDEMLPEYSMSVEVAVAPSTLPDNPVPERKFRSRPLPTITRRINLENSPLKHRNHVSPFVR